MALSTSWVDGTTFFAVDLNDLTYFAYHRSSSDHLHSGTYAPVFSTADYMPTFSTADYSPPSHLHTTVYAPISGSTVYISGTSTNFISGSSTDFAPISGSTVYISGTTTDIGLESNPPIGYFKINNIYVDSSGGIVVEYTT